MNTLKSRSYKGKIDLTAISQLLKACEVVDPPDQWPSVSDILMQFDAPLVDKAHDVCLWEDDNKLRAVAGLMIPESGAIIDGFLWFRLHPETRFDNLYGQIITWAKKRMQEVAQERGADVKLLAGTHADQTERISLLENFGFSIERYFLTMVRPLTEPILKPQLPEGFQFQQIRGEEDAEKWVEMFNDTFIDHWNYHPETIEAFKHKLTNRQFRPELSLIITAGDSEFAAFCDCYITDSNQGWLNPLGTRRGYRKQGLARAMLQEVMQRLKAEEVNTAMLYVDAENLSGALRLYESVGFQKVSTQIAYIKEV